MAAHKGQINYDVRFNADTASLQKIKTELMDLQKLTVQDMMVKNPQLGLKEARSQLIDIKRDAAEVQIALEKAFNQSLGSINISKFDAELKKSNVDLSQVYTNFMKLGSTGTQAFQQLSSAVLTSNLKLKETHKILDNIGQTMFNTAKWGIASSVFNNMTSSIQQAWNYTKGLDTSLNNIMIVTTKSSDQMERFAKQANIAAQKLGASTRDYTDAALIYYQQGLNDVETAARAEVTVKAANVTGQSGDAVSEQLTAIWNGYKVAAEETELYIDKVAKVAAATAADLNEMATAMSKVASAANSAGVDIDHLNGMLATVISVTREAPETVGTSFRTIFARLGDLSLGKTDEEGVDLGNVSGKLHQLGVEVLDQTGNMRDMQDIIADVAAKWQDWTQAQRQAAAVAMAGKMQYSRLIALFDNWDMYTKAVEDSVGAAGELQREQDIYMESTAAHLQQLSTAWQRVYDAAIDNGKANGIIDFLTAMTNGVANWAESMGGMTQILGVLGSTATKVFSKQIASAINTSITNFESATFNAKQLQNQIEQLKLLDKASGGKDVGTSVRLREREGLQQYTGNMSNEQITQANDLIDKYAEAASQVQRYEQDIIEATNAINRTMSSVGEGTFDSKALLEKNAEGDFTQHALELQEEAYEAINSQQQEDIALSEQLIQKYGDILDLRKAIEQSVTSDEEEEYFKDLEKAVDEYILKLEELSKRTDISDATKTQLLDAKATIEGMDLSVESSKKNKTSPRDVKGVNANTKALEKGSKAIEKSFAEITKKEQQASKSIENLSSNYEMLQLKEEAAKDTAKEYIREVTREDAINTLTKTVGAFGQLASAAMVFKNLGNIWSNEDLSSGEKILQTMMSLGTTIPMVISSIKTLSDSWSTVTTFSKAFAESFANTIVKTGSQITSNTALVISNKQVEQSEQAISNAKTKGVAATGEKIAGNTAEIASNEALAVSNKAVQATSGGAEAGLAGVGTATTGVSMAAGEGAAAVGELGASLGAVAAAAAIAVAAIALVAGAIYLGVKAYNADEDAAKKAAEAAKEASERFNDASEIYKSSLDEISKYQEAQEGLKTLKEGTIEWKNAVNELNMQVLDLIEKYPELLAVKGALSSDNGVLSLSQDSIDTMLYTRYNTMQAASRDKLMTQALANDARNKADLTKTTRGIASYTIANPDYSSYKASMNNNTLTSNYSSRETQPNLVKSVTNEDVQKVLDALNKTGTSIWKLSDKDFAKEVGLADKEAAAVIKDARKDIMELNNSINKNTVASDTLREQYVDSYVRSRYVTDTINKGKRDKLENYLGLEEDQKAVVSRMVQGYYENFEKNNKEQYNKIQDRYDSGAFGWSWAGGGRSDKEVHKEYAEAMGYEYVSDDNGKGTFKDANDKEITVDDDDIREFLKSEAMLKQAAKKTEEYAKQLSETYDKGIEIARNFNLNTSETQNFLKNVAGGQKIDFSTASDEELNAYKELRDSDNFAKGKNALITKEMAQAAGYDSVKAFIKAWDEEYDKWTSEENVAERAVNRAKAEQEAYNQAIKDGAKELDISENELKDYVAIVQKNNDALKEDKLLAVDVAKAAIQFGKGVQKMGDAISSNEQLLEDWRNGLTESEEALAAVAELQDAFKETFGVNVSADFIKKNFEDIEKLVNGDTSALQRLQAEAAKDVFVQLHLPEDKFNQISAMIDDINTKDIEIGADLDDQGFIDTLNTMMENGNMTAEQVQQALNAIGYEPEFEPIEGETTPQEPITTETKLSAKVAGVDLGDVVSLKATTTLPAQVVEALGISAKGTSGSGGKTQKLKGAKKTSSVGSRSQAAQNSGKSGKKTGSGGGGSSKDPKQIDKLDDEADRYHKVDTQIKKVDNSLKKLQSQQDKFVGAALLDNLTKQWEQLNTQVQNYNEKLRIAQGEQAELRAKLAGAGVQFNADGTISNYMQAFQAQLNRVNGLISQYNGLSAEQQEQWDNAKTIDNAKEQFNKFKENMDRYDELVSDFIPGLQQDIQDAIDQQIEINIKKFNYEVEIKLDMSEAEREWNDWKKRVLDRVDEDDILGNTTARLQDFSSYYMNDGTGSIQVQTRHLSDLLDELDRMDKGLDNVYGNNRAQALEDLKNYYEQLMDDLEGVMNLQDEIHEAYMDMMDEAQEKFDKQLDTYELITDTVSHDMKLIQMIMGDEAYTQLNNYYKAQQNNYDKQVDFQRQQVQFWHDQMETLEKGSDEWEKATENWKDALKDWQSSIEDALENIRDKFENTINEIFKKLNDKVTDGLGLDYVSEQWDLIDKKSESYLDTINALQGINNIESKYLKSINDSQNTAAQKKLREAMNAELDTLRNRDRLTKADLERAEKRYQLVLAQIALEEAQQNKSQMRLRRDSQGNYTYQYAADDDAVREAQDNLGELYSDLYNFDKEQYTSTLDEIYEIYDEYQQKMAEAALINDPELRAERELLIQEYYGDLINGLVERNEIQKLNLHESAFQDLAYLYDTDLESFTNLTETEKDLIMEDLIPQWDSGVQHMVDVFAGEGGFEEVTKRALQEIVEATAEYDEDLHNLADTAGVAFDDVCYGIDETIEFTEALLDDNNDLIDSYDRQLDAVKKVIDEVDALVNKYNDARVAAERATEAAYKYWQEQQRQAAAKAASTSTTSAGASGSGPNAGSGGSSGAGSGNGNLEVGDVVTYKGGGYYTTSYGGSYGNRGPGGQVTVTIIKNDGRPYPIHVTSSNSAYGWLRKDQLSGYDTGGYTGDWEGDPTNGKLALLHQKELVLNADDTKNLLDTVAIMRNLANTLGANVLSRLAGVSASMTPQSMNNRDELEQNVHIEAQFPNVTNSKEIEDALNNLVNSASQRIYENNR